MSTLTADFSLVTFLLFISHFTLDLRKFSRCDHFDQYFLMKISAHWCWLKNPSSVLTIPIINCCMKSRKSVYSANPLSPYSQSTFHLWINSTSLGNWELKTCTYCKVCFRIYKQNLFLFFHVPGDRFLVFFSSARRLNE